MEADAERRNAKARMAARKEALRLKRANAAAEPAAEPEQAADTPAPMVAAQPSSQPADTAGDTAGKSSLQANDQLQQALEAQRVAEKEAASLKELMALQAEGIGTMQDELGRLHEQLAAARAEKDAAATGLPVTDAKQLRSLRRRARALAAEFATNKQLLQQLVSDTAAGLETATAGAARLKMDVARSAQRLASLETASELLREQLTSERMGRQEAQAATTAAEQRAAAADERVARETQQLRDEAEEAIAERDALEKASKTRNARFAKVQTAHTKKLELLEAELADARLNGAQANQNLETEVGRLAGQVSALEATLQDSEASAAEAAEAAAESSADASAAKMREQELRKVVFVAQEEARQATARAKEVEAYAAALEARANAAEAAVAAADEERAAAIESAAQQVEAAGGAIEALVAERDAAKANAASLTEQIDALVGRQGRLVEEMMAQDEKLQRLLGDGAVDRNQVASALVAFFQAEDAPRKQEILQLLANILSFSRDQCIEVGLVSRWEHLQPEITASIDAGEAGLSDAFATFIAAEGKS